MWNHALSLLEENLMNLKLLCLFFDSSLTVQQTNTWRGSSALLKFQSFPVFQPRSVSSPNFCVLMLTLVGNKCTWSETTISLLGFPTCRATNKYLPRELYHVKVRRLLMFSDQVLLFCLLQCFDAETDRGKFHSIWNYYIPSCIPN